MSVAVQSKACVCRRLIAGIAGSNPANSMEFSMLCIVRVAASATGWSHVHLTYVITFHKSIKSHMLAAEHVNRNTHTHYQQTYLENSLIRKIVKI
jgi:hypothetical protein